MLYIIYILKYNLRITNSFFVYHFFVTLERIPEAISIGKSCDLTLKCIKNCLEKYDKFTDVYIRIDISKEWSISILIIDYYTLKKYTFYRHTFYPFRKAEIFTLRFEYIVIEFIRNGPVARIQLYYAHHGHQILRATPSLSATMSVCVYCSSVSGWVCRANLTSYVVRWVCWCVFECVCVCVCGRRRIILLFVLIFCSVLGMVTISNVHGYDYKINKTIFFKNEIFFIFCKVPTLCTYLYGVRLYLTKSRRMVRYNNLSYQIVVGKCVVKIDTSTYHYSARLCDTPVDVSNVTPYNLKVMFYTLFPLVFKSWEFKNYYSDKCSKINPYNLT